jgi:hypothetical protein
VFLIASRQTWWRRPRLLPHSTVLCMLAGAPGDLPAGNKVIKAQGVGGVHSPRPRGQPASRSGGTGLICLCLEMSSQRGDQGELHAWLRDHGSRE